jgi:hypothetical protein
VAFEVWLPENLPEKTADFTADELDELAEILRDLAEDPLRSDGLTFLHMPNLGQVAFISGERIWVSFQVDRAGEAVYVGGCGRYRPPPLNL